MEQIKNKNGTSVVIALGLISAILVFTIGIATTVMTAIQNTSNSKKSLQAEYAAQSGLEMAKFEIADLATAAGDGVDWGYLSVDLVCDTEGQCGVSETGGLYGDVDGDQSIYVGYEVVTLDEEDDTEYPGGLRSIPVLGTGDAGSDCGSYKHSLGDLSSSDHPCNWNKIYYGKSVDIPLYVVIGGEVNDPLALGLNSFELQVRSSCVGESSEDCERYAVDISDFDVVGGRTLLSWQITAECDDGVCGITQIPGVLDGVLQEEFFSPSSAKVDSSKNGEDVFNGDQGAIIDFLYNAGAWAGSGNTEAVFKLSYIQQALSDGDTIPYLEYQFLYGDDVSLASVFRVNVDGYAQGFEYSLNGVQGINSALFDFAVQN